MQTNLVKICFIKAMKKKQKAFERCSDKHFYGIYRPIKTLAPKFVHLQFLCFNSQENPTLTSLLLAKKKQYSN